MTYDLKESKVIYKNYTHKINLFVYIFFTYAKDDVWFSIYSTNTAVTVIVVKFTKPVQFVVVGLTN